MHIITSITHALNGLRQILATELNARIHLSSAILALVLGIVLEVSPAELAAIFFAVVIVFLAEIFNTVIEKTLDIIDTAHNPRIMIIKDMLAGSVLVASGAAVLIGLAIFFPYFLELLWRR